jgi:hypothetical protein
MFVLPVSGYKFEGINDLKRIERTFYSDHPYSTSTIIPAVDPDTPQPSLLGHVSAVLAATDIISLTTAGVTIGDVHEAMPVLTSGSTAAAYDCSVSPWPSPPLNPMSTFNALNGMNTGEATTRARSTSESIDEWAALQKRKEMGAGAGVAGAISMGGPVAVGIGGGMGGIGIIPGPMVDVSLLGDFSKEHMGHEAYYYRNWFLGKGISIVLVLIWLTVMTLMKD